MQALATDWLSHNLTALSFNVLVTVPISCFFGGTVAKAAHLYLAAGLSTSCLFTTDGALPLVVVIGLPGERACDLDAAGGRVVLQLFYYGLLRLICDKVC